MTQSSQADSVQRLVNELRAAPATPVILAGETGSGCTSVVRSAGEKLGCELVECMAAQLVTIAPTAPPPGTLGMINQLDAIVALAALRDGDERRTLVVIDHLDAPVVDNLDGVVEAMEWISKRVQVVAITGANPPAGLPADWPVVAHTAHDVARYWSGETPRPTVVFSLE